MSLQCPHIATVWHEGSKSFYKAVLLEPLSVEDVQRETAAAAGDPPEPHFATTADVHAQGQLPLPDPAPQYDIDNGTRWPDNTFTDKGHGIKAGQCSAMFRDGQWLCDRCSVKWAHDTDKPPCKESP